MANPITPSDTKTHFEQNQSPKIDYQKFKRNLSDDNYEPISTITSIKNDDNLDSFTGDTIEQRVIKKIMVNQYHNDEENNTTACRQFIRDENSECQIVNNGLTVKNNNTNNNNNNNYSDIQNYNNSTDNNLTRTNM